MRLLQCEEDRSFRLTEDLAEDDLPPYAILSHRWLAVTDEPTFEDVFHGRARGKLGYQKLRFCAEQARRCGLQYFWVDTCCIDKDNKAELSTSIESMFRWYQNAAICYVYLSDVTSRASGGAERSNLQSSAWFTRGWTLQELLAPRSVVFFSAEEEIIGDKSSLEQLIHEITAIPRDALRGTKPLHHFSVDQRLAWMTTRETTLEEDKAYSLAGMFNVQLAPVYGEGFAQAHRRLRGLVDKRDKCIRDLRLSNSQDNKERIKLTKGGLLVDAYKWILDNPRYIKWRDSGQRQMLWIKGDPGKGKTMLLYGIVDELKNQLADRDLLSYFFCQAGDVRINSASAVLRGLMFLLIDRQPSLASHLQEEYDRSSKNLFEDVNAWVALSEVFTRMLQDSSFGRAYLIIDALDECVEDSERLIDFIRQTSTFSTKVKWLVSSRNLPSIKERISRVDNHDEVSLELNAGAVSGAVRVFIKHRVLQLSVQKSYSKDLQSTVLRHLYTNAKDTFLWVALSCQYLSSVPIWDTVPCLKRLPPGLNNLYIQMWKHICASDYVDLCKSMLSIITVLYRPATLAELTCIMESLSEISNDPAALTSMIEHCGSFLTVREGYLCPSLCSGVPIEGGVWRAISNRKGTGALRNLLEVTAESLPHPWARHATSSRSTLSELVQDALRFTMYHKQMIETYPLQTYVSALLFSPQKSIIRRRFRQDAPTWVTVLPPVEQDWSACIQTLEGHSGGVSSVVFSADSSRLASASWDNTVKIWDASSGQCLRTVEGHSGGVSSVVCSADSSRLASASWDHKVKIWDASSGQYLRTLEGHSDGVSSVVFSADSSRLASASYDTTVKIWDASSGQCLQTLQVDRVPHRMSFNVIGSFVDTDIGCLPLDASSSPRLLSLSHNPRHVNNLGAGISADRLWIKYDSSNVVWLPSERRPLCSDTTAQTVGIGVGNGRVWFCSFIGEDVPRAQSSL